MTIFKMYNKKGEECQVLPEQIDMMKNAGYTFEKQAEKIIEVAKTEIKKEQK